MQEVFRSVAAKSHGTRDDLTPESTAAQTAIRFPRVVQKGQRRPYYKMGNVVGYLPEVSRFI